MHVQIKRRIVKQCMLIFSVCLKIEIIKAIFSNLQTAESVFLRKFPSL